MSDARSAERDMKLTTGRTSTVVVFATVCVLVALSLTGVSAAAVAHQTRMSVAHCLTPKIKGLTVQAATKRIHRAGCRVGTLRHQASTARQKSHVLSQRPGPGKKLRSGARVNLVVGSGPNAPTPTPGGTSATVSVGRAVVRPSASLTTSGRGFKPLSSVHLILHSDPIDLGTVVVGADGSFSKSVVVPATVPDGVHHVIAEGQDRSGASVAPTAELSIDSSPPQVDFVTASPDVASPGGTVTITAHVTDESGVQALELQSNLTGSAGNTPFCDSYATLTSGTSTDGIWSISCAVTDHTLSGDYIVTPYAEDIAGNWVNTNGGVTSPARGAFSITGGLAATTPPVVLSISATPATATPGQSLVVSAHVTSPVGVQAIELQALLDGSNGTSPFCDRYATLSSGTTLDGIWSMTCMVPAQVLSGDYTITPYAEDIAGNWVNTNGGPPSATRATFTVTGGLTNVAPPTITSVDVNPSTVTVGQTFTVSARVTSPVGVQAIELQSTAVGVSGNSPFCDRYGTLTSGSTTDGIWSIQCTVPPIVAAGSYVVTPYAEDVLGQWVNTNGGPPSATRGSFTVS